MDFAAVRNALQQGIYTVINPFVRLLIKIGFTPNAVTLTGLLLNIGVAVLFIVGGEEGNRGDLRYVGWGGALILFAGLFDMLDGQVARLGNMKSEYGALFDSVLDRYSELFTFLGICYYLVAHHYLLGSLFAFIALIGSMMVSYTRARAEAAEAVRAVSPHAQYLAAIRAALPRDGILVEELCQTGFTSYFAYPVLAPRTYVSPGYQGTLGCGFMTALGVKAAHPDRPVVSITGDGGFLFGVGELATARQYGLNLVTILFNNGAYGNVLRDQERGFGGRLIGAELQNPDFPALAAAFGVAAHRVDAPDALAGVLAEALRADAPVLIEVAIDRASEVSPWPFIHPPR